MLHHDTLRRTSATAAAAHQLCPPCSCRQPSPPPHNTCHTRCNMVLHCYVWLRAGDKVVADGVVVESHGLVVDEASLTGESDPIKKSEEDPWCRSGTQVSVCVWGGELVLLLSGHTQGHAADASSSCVTLLTACCLIAKLAVPVLQHHSLCCWAHCAGTCTPAALVCHPACVTLSSTPPVPRPLVWPAGV